MAKREPPLKIEASFEDAVRAFLKTPPPPAGHPSTRKSFVPKCEKCGADMALIHSTRKLICQNCDPEPKPKKAKKKAR